MSHHLYCWCWGPIDRRTRRYIYIFGVLGLTTALLPIYFTRYLFICAGIRGSHLLLMFLLVFFSDSIFPILYIIYTYAFVFAWSHFGPHLSLWRRWCDGAAHRHQSLLFALSGSFLLSDNNNNIRYMRCQVNHMVRTEGSRPRLCWIHRKFWNLSGSQHHLIKKGTQARTKGGRRLCVCVICVTGRDVYDDYHWDMLTDGNGHANTRSLTTYECDTLLDLLRSKLWPTSVCAAYYSLCVCSAYEYISLPLLRWCWWLCRHWLLYLYLWAPSIHQTRKQWQ